MYICEYHILNIPLPSLILYKNKYDNIKMREVRLSFTVVRTNIRPTLGGSGERRTLMFGNELHMTADENPIYTTNADIRLWESRLGKVIQSSMSRLEEKDVLWVNEDVRFNGIPHHIWRQGSIGRFIESYILEGQKMRVNIPDSASSLVGIIIDNIMTDGDSDNSINPDLIFQRGSVSKVQYSTLYDYDKQKDGKCVLNTLVNVFSNKKYYCKAFVTTKRGGDITNEKLVQSFNGLCDKPCKEGFNVGVKTQLGNFLPCNASSNYDCVKETLTEPSLPAIELT